MTLVGRWQSPFARDVLAPALLAGVIALLPGVASFGQESGGGSHPQLDTLEKLGGALFQDTNLSKNRSQACVSCHSPQLAFTDPREMPKVGGAVSTGDDGRSLGDRNAPTVTYASLTPHFQIKADGKPAGGLFLDGRAKTLEEQAAGPPLNPIEMGMPDKASVVTRLKENPSYIAAFDALFGEHSLDDTERGYAAMTKAIAAFERTPNFAPFDSKYDRYLRGEVELTDQEELGRVLFFSSQFTNCSKCHRLATQGGVEKEPFTNYEYRNIGVPVNHVVRAENSSAPGRIDHGLLTNNPAVTDKAHDGQFKVPTLRNVAVTGPYMHNGVFKDLRTVVLFYNKYNSKNPKRQINPETNAPWDTAEVSENIALDELKAPALDDKRVDALVAFMKTLTDKRYEHLLGK